MKIKFIGGPHSMTIRGISPEFAEGQVVEIESITKGYYRWDGRAFVCFDPNRKPFDELQSLKDLLVMVTRCPSLYCKQIKKIREQIKELEKRKGA